MPRKRCSKCGKWKKISQFYERSGRPGTRFSWCITCFNIDTLRRGKEKRNRAIDFLGGECYYCGFDEYYALDFHHLEPEIKDLLFNNMRYWSWERIKEEIRECILLCKNCHSGVEQGIIKLDL